MRVLVVLNVGVPSGMQKFAGVRRFVADTRAWEIVPVRTCWDFTPACLERALANGVNGILFSMEESKDGVDMLSRMTMPTVVIDSPRGPFAERRRNIAFFATDNAAIARMAADSFLSQGVFRSYVCAVNDVESWWAKARAAAFVKYLKSKGAAHCAILNGDATPREAAAFLAAQPRPCAVFAVNDDRALHILHLCRDTGLSVPGDIAILGVDNDEMVCLYTDPTLSSIEVDFEGASYRGAQLLDEMMRGRALNEPVVQGFGGKCVVVRDSMMRPTSAGKVVQRAVAYINAHATEGIGVADVVAHIGVSRSLADRYFRRLQNTSINDAIVMRRLDVLKERLVTSDAAIDEIVAECGFASPSYPKTLFKRRFGLSMRDFRRQNTP